MTTTDARKRNAAKKAADQSTQEAPGVGLRAVELAWLADALPDDLDLPSAGLARFAEPAVKRIVAARVAEVERERARAFAEANRHAAELVNAQHYEAAFRSDLADLRAGLAAGEASDGHHTHNELYEYRLIYNAHAAHGWLATGVPVVKSWRHSDGELAFGGGWFIVVATLPTGQVSNHYQVEHWDLFQVPEVDLPPTYDGHSPAAAAERLHAAALTSDPAAVLAKRDAEKWRQGYASGHSNAMRRMSDEPNAPTTPNPYERQGGDDER